MLTLKAATRLKLIQDKYNLEDLLETLILNNLNDEFYIVIRRNINDIDLNLIERIINLIVQIKNFDALLILYNLGLSEDLEEAEYNSSYINKDFAEYTEDDIRTIFRQKDYYTFYSYISSSQSSTSHQSHQINQLYINLAEEYLEPIFSLILMTNPSYHNYYNNNVDKLYDMMKPARAVDKKTLIYCYTILKHLDKLNFDLLSVIVDYMQTIDKQLSLFLYYNTKFCVNTGYINIIKLIKPIWNNFEMTNDETHLIYESYRDKIPGLYRIFNIFKEPKCLIKDENISCPNEKINSCIDTLRLLIKLAIKFNRVEFIKIILMFNLDFIDDESFILKKDDLNFIPKEFLNDNEEENDNRSEKEEMNLLKNCDIDILKLILSNQKCNKDLIFNSIYETNDELFKNINIWNPNNILDVSIDNFDKILRIHHNDYHLNVYAKVFENIPLNNKDLMYRFYNLCNYDLFYELIGHKKYLFMEHENMNNLDTYRYIYNSYRNIKYKDGEDIKEEYINDTNILNEISDFSLCIVDDLFIILMYYYSLVKLDQKLLYNLFKNRIKIYDNIIVNEINYMKEGIKCDLKICDMLTQLLTV